MILILVVCFARQKANRTLNERAKEAKCLLPLVNSKITSRLRKPTVTIWLKHSLSDE